MGTKTEIKADRHFDLEKASVKGFRAFCGNNIPLIASVIIALFFAYGIKLFWYNIGIDTGTFWADKDAILAMHNQVGRFGLSLLAKLWHIKEFNPFTSFFAAFCLIGLFTVSWCYIIAIFSGNTGTNHTLIPFALLFMTMPVWAELFYFTLNAAEMAFIIGLCPYVIYLLYKGFLDNEKVKIICAFLLLVFMLTVYQAIVPLFCCGVLGCFLFLRERSGFEPRVYRLLSLKFLFTLLSALAVYFCIDRIIAPFFFHIQRLDYLDRMFEWGSKPVIVNLFDLFMFCYCLTIGHIPLVQNIARPIFEREGAAGLRMFEYFSGQSRFLGNILLLPCIVLFLIAVCKTRANTVPPGQRLLFKLAGIGVPLCIVLMSIIGGSAPPARSLFALPLAWAFMVFYLLNTYQKKARAAVTCLALLAAMYQAEVTAQLFYSDQLRYNEEVQIAFKLKEMITPAQSGTGKIPVAIVGGNLQSAYQGGPNFLPGEVNGQTRFGYDESDPALSAYNSLNFMRTLGIQFNFPGRREQMDRALKEAESMPSYPDPGCVRRLPDVIVVKLSMPGKKP